MALPRVTDPANMPQALALAFDQIEHGEPWHEVGATGEPAFANSWVNYDTTRKARFRKDVMGVVRLAGIIKSGTVAATAFTLPSGYWPDYVDATNTNQVFPVVSNGAFGYLSVLYDGRVQPASGSNISFILDGITFRAAA